MKYKNPAATSSMIVERRGNILLVERKHEPFQGMLALPGGFLDYGKETLEQAAVRELAEETSLKARTQDLILLCVNSSPTRDPRGHVIDHVYIVTQYQGQARANDDASRIIWTPLDNVPCLAFDHSSNIERYIKFKQGK